MLSLATDVRLQLLLSVRLRKETGNLPSANLQTVMINNNDDIISTFFWDEPVLQQNELKQIYKIPCRVLQSQYVENGLLDKHNNTKPIPTAAPDSGSGDVKIGIQDADKYLYLIRSRTVYFPFVQVPDVSGASKAVHYPFLLLAILAVIFWRNSTKKKKSLFGFA